MSVTETTTASWFSRLKSALFGILLGIVLILGSAVLLFWNEGRAVETYKSLTEGLSIVINAQSSRLDPALDGKLIHVEGKVTVQETAEDSLTGVTADGAIVIIRRVEMYQWTERQESSSEKTVGGSEKTTTTYSYAREWSSAPQPSGNFKQPEGHQNPVMPVEGASFPVATARLGVFGLDGKILAPLGILTTLTFTQQQAQEIGARLGLSRPTQWSDGTVYSGADSSSPEIGDLRISYQRIDLDEASFVARQTGDRLTPYTASNGYSVFLSAAGFVPADQMFADARTGNTLITWVLRAAGLLLMFFGFAAALKIFSVIGDVVPVIGMLIGFGTAFVALLATLCLGLAVIALGWFAARPILAIGLLAGAGAIITLLLVLRRR